MPQLSQSQVYALARDAGLGPMAAVTAAAVSQAESGLRTDAQGDVGLEEATWARRWVSHHPRPLDSPRGGHAWELQRERRT